MNQKMSIKGNNGRLAIANGSESTDRTRLSIYQQPSPGKQHALATVVANNNVPVTPDSILSRDGDLAALVAEVARETGASGKFTETVEIIYED